MSITAALLPEFDQEMSKTRTALERVPGNRFSWKPHEKSFSFLELTNHIARLPLWGTSTIQKDSLDLKPEGGLDLPPVAQDTQGVLAVFDKTVAEMRAALAGASDEVLMAPWTLYMGGEKVFTMPRVAVLRAFILNHILHHRGQLTVYLRLIDVPVPALYGPSADEGM